MTLSRVIYAILSVIPRIVGVLFVLWALGFVLFLSYVIHQKTPSVGEPTTGIVVFTGEEGRISEGVFVWRAQGKKPYLRISGVSTSSPFSRMPSFPASFSLDQARNTKENILFTSRWIRDYRIASLRLITSDYHMPRCLLLARTWPPSLRVLAHPIHSLSRVWFFYAFIEYHKFLCVFLAQSLR